MGNRLLRTQGIFERLHNELVGTNIDFGAFDPTDFPPDLIELARDVWGERVQSEFRSIQVMTRFTSETLDAGDPLEVYAGAADAILDEIRHTALCVGMLEALGGEPELPDPVSVEQHPEFLALPKAQQAMSTALNMLAVNETLSTGFIEDLQTRCKNPVVRAVLDITLADEDTHHEFGWSYVEKSLERFNTESMEVWRMVVQHALQPHLISAEQVLSDIPLHLRQLDAWPEPELVELGLLSPQRQALVFQERYQTELAPKLAALDLLPDDTPPS